MASLSPPDLHSVVEDGDFHTEQAGHGEDALDVVVLHEQLEPFQYSSSLTSQMPPRETRSDQLRYCGAAIHHIPVRVPLHLAFDFPPGWGDFVFVKLHNYTPSTPGKTNGIMQLRYCSTYQYGMRQAVAAMTSASASCYA